MIKLFEERIIGLPKPRGKFLGICWSCGRNLYEGDKSYQNTCGPSTLYCCHRQECRHECLIFGAFTS